MVSQALAAADAAAELDGCGVVALPWLRGIDGAWLAEVAGGAPIVCLDNHYVARRPGRRRAARARGEAPEAAARTRLVGVDGCPQCGENDEVLRAHGLDAAGLVELLRG